MTDTELYVDAWKTATVHPENQSQEEFQRLLDNITSTNSELWNVLRLLEGDIVKWLSSNKRQDLLVFLSDPLVFEKNPSQYTKLFEFLRANLDEQTLKILKDTNIKVYNKYIKYSNKFLKSELDTAAQAIDIGWRWRSIDSKETKWSDESVNWNLKKILEWEEEINLSEWEKLRSVLAWAYKINWEITKILPSWEQERIDQFIRNNQNLITNSPNESIRILSDEKDKNTYLESLYYLQFGWEIRQRISEQYKWDPIEQTRVLKEYDTKVGELKQLDIIRPESSVSKAFEGNFAPTRPAETARIQAEKLEKTHDVYRDGTSLYFVNKSDPKDIRKIEIYADRAVLTVMQGGLSLSRDMTLLSHEETEERKEIRKAEGISGEKSRETETVWWVFFQMRGWEYATIPWGSRSTVDILRSRPSRSIQEQYESYEELLATKSPEELRKESDSSRQSRWAIIERMLDLSRQLFADNQQYFAPWAFWEEKLLNEADQVKSKLDTRISWLKVYKSSIDTAEKVSNDLSKLQRAFNPGDKIDMSVWEGRARAYLKEAVSDNIWLDGFSDSQFQQLLYQLEQKDSSGWVWKGWIELGTDTVRRDHQLRELEDIARKIQVDGSMRTWWQWLGRKIDQEGTPENIAWKWNKEQFWNWYKSITTPSEGR